MKKRAELLTALKDADSFETQQRILADLHSLDREAAMAKQADRDVDWADTVVRQTLSPVRTHELHTAATSWIESVDTSGSDYHHEIIAKVSAWYNRVSPEVKADREEFQAQASGIVRREASVYGESANLAASAALDYLSFLRQREGASGLPQIEQTVAPDGVTSQPTPIPGDVFDNFAPPVHPINEGVVGTEGSDRAPLLQQNPPGGGQQETLHSTAPVTTQPDNSPAHSASLVQAPSLAIGHVMNLDQFRAMQAQAAKDVTGGEAYPDPSDARTLEGLGYVSPLGVGNVDVIAAPGAGDSGSERMIQNARRKTAADGDSQGIDDNRYAPGTGSSDQNGSAAIDKLVEATGMSADEVRQKYPNPQAAVMLLDAGQTKQSALHEAAGKCKNCTNGNHTGTNGSEDTKCSGGSCSCGCRKQASRREAAQVIYHEQYGDVTRPQLAAYRKHNISPSDHDDLVRHFGEDAHDQITKWVKDQGAGGKMVSTFDLGREHWASKTAASGLDQIQQTTAPDGVTQRPTPLPGEVAFPLNEVTEMTSDQLLDGDTRAAVEKAAALDDASSTDCRSCGESLGGGTGVTSAGESAKTCSNCGVKNFVQRKASRSFTPPDAMAHPEFFKGYGYGRRWKTGSRLMNLGSAEFEAGVYAGITDNYEARGAWVAAHAKQAAQYPALAQRIEFHDAFTQRLASKTGAKVDGIYVTANPLLALAPLVRAVAPAVIGGITGDDDESEKTAALRTQSVGYPLECYSCGRTGDLSDMHNGRERKCPDCGSYEVHSPEAHDNWKPKKGSKTATTETDLSTVSPGTSPSPTGDTPINGPGRPGPLAGYEMPAAPGGPAPYNGAEPYGKPVVPGAVAPAQIVAPEVTQSGPPNPLASQQTVAFRRAVQAGLLHYAGKGKS